MPKKNVADIEELIRFVRLARSGRFTVTEMCEQLAISRKTGHRHMARYAELSATVSRHIENILAKF